MGIRYRELESDVKDALRFIRIQEAVGWGRYRPGPEALLRAVARRRAQEGLRVFLLEVEGRVAGYCEVLSRPRAALAAPEGCAYVQSIAVDPALEGRGLVVGFARHILGVLALEGCPGVVADVAAENGRSLNLNATLGARFLGASPAAVAHAAGGGAHLRVRLPTAARRAA
jgi:L-amino acid N-acyltransferase YncA